MRIYIDSHPFKICYHIKGDINESTIDSLKSILLKDINEFNPDDNFLKNHVEIGPRRNFKTSWNSNVLEILFKCGINDVESIEYSTFYPKDFTPDIDKMLYEEFSDYNDIKDFEKSYYVLNIIKFNKTHKLGFDEQDINYYQNIFKDLQRPPTNVELYDLSQCNSEHARHWFFRGKFSENEIIIDEPNLINKLKTTLNKNGNSLISFKDNASVIKGKLNDSLIVVNNKLKNIKSYINFSYKAETHNFPTGISPFPGAATGVGGRIRDNLAVGNGGRLIAGTAGYCVGDINQEYEYVLNSPRRILIEASNGASDYGNKIGEPLIQGFTRTYRKDFNEGRIEYLKPIMFSGGMGRIIGKDVHKGEGKFGDLIVRIGGPAYNIGMGGGSASSRSHDDANQEQDFSAVQRGDPEMANKVSRFVENCCILNDNPIISIHDQGSGGMANVTREISEPLGAKIFLDNIEVGDKSMNSLEKWVAEYQEQITILVKPINLKLVRDIAKRENVSLKVVGYIDNQRKIETISKLEENKIIDLPLLDDNFQKVFPIKKPNYKYTLPKPLNKASGSLIEKIKLVFNHISVCSKGFLVNKVDRSVTGLIGQQQCIGPYQLPLSNYAIVMAEYTSDEGMVSAIGEKPINGIYDRKSMVEMTVSEMLCNMMWVNTPGIEFINSVANWMWSSTEPEEAYKLRESLDILVDTVKKLGFSINGGKDSLSMNVKRHKQNIKAPNTLVLSGYTNCKNVHNKITPDLKSTNSTLLLLKINSKTRLGGSVYQDVLNINSKIPCPRIDSLPNLKNIFEKVQRLISYDLILSGHDKSDGGLITTLIEMSISSGIGLDIFGNNDFLFNEEMGVVIEVENSDLKNVTSRLFSYKIAFDIVGLTNSSKYITVKENGKVTMKEKITHMRLLWSLKSLEMEREQTNLKCVEMERESILNESKINYKINDDILRRLNFFEMNLLMKNKKDIRVGILRDEGSNGDKEMRAAFYLAGFEVFDICMDDLIQERVCLDEFRGIVFVGGFSYSDVLGAGRGWMNVIKNNKKLKKQFDSFYERNDTFSLGICNGCQLMSLLGYVDDNIKLKHNISGRFESRFSLVKIEKNNNIFLENLEGMIMGIWSAHGEGKIEGKEKGNYPIRYVDNDWKVTEKYPYNPNGSSGGICGFSSACGRHLAMMPHPERCILNWQIPYFKKGSDLEKIRVTPWCLMFRNVFNWCLEN